MFIREERNNILTNIILALLAITPTFFYASEQEGLTSDQATLLISLAEDAMHLKVTINDDLVTKPIFFTNYKTGKGELSYEDVLRELCVQAVGLYDERQGAKLPGLTILSDNSLDELEKLELQLVRFGRWLRLLKKSDSGDRKS